MIRGFWFISKIKNCNSFIVNCQNIWPDTWPLCFSISYSLDKEIKVYLLQKKKKKTNILTLCAESWRKNSQKHYDWQKGLHFLYLSKIKSQIYFDEDNVRLNVTSYCKLPLHSLAQKATYQYKIILKAIAIRLNCNEHTKILNYAAITTHLDHSMTNVDEVVSYVWGRQEIVFDRRGFVFQVHCGIFFLTSNVFLTIGVYFFNRFWLFRLTYNAWN